MLEQDATPVSDLYPTWCAVGQEHDIHGHLCGQSETIQGICSHRYNLRLVSFGYSLGNVFNRWIYYKSAKENQYKIKRKTQFLNT